MTKKLVSMRLSKKTLVTLDLLTDKLNSGSKAQAIASAINVLNKILIELDNDNDLIIEKNVAIKKKSSFYRSNFIMNKKRELLFSITKKDFRIEPYKGSGNGGQKRNKTMSCVRITHPDSGASAIGTEHREQSRNKKAAFRRLIETDKFKVWHTKKIAEMSLDKHELERKTKQALNNAMKPENIKIEYGPFEDNV